MITQRRFSSHSTGGAFGAACKRNLLVWAIMADKFGMAELCGHCELALMKFWDCFHASPEADQLSSGALQRIALGLNKTLLALRAQVNQLSRRDPCFQEAPYHEERESQYPGVHEVIAWRQEKQQPKPQPSSSKVEGKVASGKKLKR